jgi:hypothetical protein
LVGFSLGWTIGVHFDRFRRFSVTLAFAGGACGAEKEVVPSSLVFSGLRE